MLLGGVIASQVQLPLAAVLAAGIGGAIVGDAVGYLVGRHCGRRILDSTVGRLMKAEHLDRAETALARRSGSAVFIGRFTVALRVLVPLPRRDGGMPYWRFAVFNVAGAVLWGGVVVLAGYLAGSSWQQVGHVISGFGVGISVAVVATLVSAAATRRHRTSRRASGRAAGARPGSAA